MKKQNNDLLSTEALVSVVLPVYNCPPYIGEAIKSILEQTYNNLEFIIIDDGSTDNTPEIVQSIHDPRIRFYQQKNQGLAATLNRGIALAHGKYIARQDQDDISMPERLSKQVNYLESHPECGMVGTWAEIRVDETKTQRSHRHPIHNNVLQFELLFNNPFVHSSIMLRKSVLDHVGVYSIDRYRQPPEDYELWSRIARSYEIANIPEILQVYREIPRSMSRSGVSPFLNHLVTISSENIAWASDAPADDSNPVNIAALIHNANHRIIGKPDFQSMNAVLQKAVARISKNDTGLKREASYRIDGLKYVYWNIKHPALRYRPIYILQKAWIKIIRVFRNQGN